MQFSGNQTKPKEFRFSAAPRVALPTTVTCGPQFAVYCIAAPVLAAAVDVLTG